MSSNEDGSPGPSAGSSPSATPIPSRSSSTNQHLPTNPSQLRQTHMPPDSPENSRADSGNDGRPDSSNASFTTSPKQMPVVDRDGVHPTNTASANLDSSSTQVGGRIEEPTEPDVAPNVRTRLLDQKTWDRSSGCGAEDCNHGTFSPRPRQHHRYGSTTTIESRNGFGGRYGGIDGVGGHDNTHEVLGDAVTDGLLGGGPGKKMSTTKWLAKTHGIKNQRLMYVVPYNTTENIRSQDTTKNLTIPYNAPR